MSIVSEKAHFLTRKRERVSRRREQRCAAVRLDGSENIGPAVTGFVPMMSCRVCTAVEYRFSAKVHMQSSKAGLLNRLFLKISDNPYRLVKKC